MPKTVVCSVTLDDTQAATFRKAVKKHYWYELFMDELPVWGFVGVPPEEIKTDDQIYIYTHKSFEINYNADRVGIFQLACSAATALTCDCLTAGDRMAHCVATEELLASLDHYPALLVCIHVSLQSSKPLLAADLKNAAGSH